MEVHSSDFTAGTYVHLDDDHLPDGAIVVDLLGASVDLATEAARGVRDDRNERVVTDAENQVAEAF